MFVDCCVLFFWGDEGVLFAVDRCVLLLVCCGGLVVWCFLLVVVV